MRVSRSAASDLGAQGIAARWRRVGTRWALMALIGSYGASAFAQATTSSARTTRSTRSARAAAAARPPAPRDTSPRARPTAAPAEPAAAAAAVGTPSSPAASTSVEATSAGPLSALETTNATAPAQAPSNLEPPKSPAAAPAPLSPLNPAPAEFPGKALGGRTSDLDQLVSRLALLRSRVAALSTALFSSKMRLELLSSGGGVRLKTLRVSVDGGVVYTAAPSASFEVPSVVHEHAVAPGAHVIGVEVERQGENDPRFSTWQMSKFVVHVPERQTLWARVELEDDSDMAEEFPQEREGEYDLRVRLQVDVSE